MEARPAQATRDHIFISYSRADSVWLDRLNTCLKPLKRADRIVVWDDSAIKPTDVWRTEIQHGLDRACIAILLVSANFFASDFIDAVELPALLQATQEGGVKILPVIIGPSRFERTALYQFQAANDPRRPLNSLPSHEADAILQQVANMCEDLFAPATAPQDVVAAHPGRPGTRAPVVPAATRASEAPLDTSRPITLLHVSDTQFGRNHRFGNLALSPDDTFDTLLTRLGDDLQYLEREHGLRPDVLVLSGDLAEWGLPGEFRDVLQFVEGLTERLQLPRQQVVIIPGNHDINRKACEAYFNDCDADEEEPRAPFWPKWRHYVQFFRHFYRDCSDITFAEAEPWTVFPMPELKLVVAGLNSTLRESHRDTDHYGHLGEAQLRWFADKLVTYKQQG